MSTFLAVIGIAILAVIAWFNTVATILVFKTPGSARLFNIFRALFVWLVPVIGFTIFLRFTRQSFECDLHDKLVPGFMRNWIYDDRPQPAYRDADRKHNQAVKFGAAEMSREMTREFRDGS